MRNKKLKYLIYALPVPVMLLSLFTGPAGNSGFSAFLSSFSWQQGVLNDEILYHILFNVRLPRILLVFIVGGILAVTGASLQAVFRNPLVDPYVLGLSSGAAFGAALGLWVSFLPMQVSAFIFSVVAVGLSYFMARKNKQISIVSLILAGIITNGIFTALLTIIQILSDPFKLQGIVHWIMGNFHNASWAKLQMAALPMVAGLIILFVFRWKLNVIALGDEEAASVGVNPGRLKLWILAGATLSGSAAVAVSGIIGLYGLIIPHTVRMLFGVDNRSALVINFLAGGTFLTLIDNISRTMAGFEVPIGVFTMLIGAPFFIWLLKKSNVGWEQ
jgi:iron complex transport system permease protein